ncbi:hypothetical protein DB30_06772 [Enhygromyxa salina]|uniref:Uncharacterized protein n=1 Tax=Enhygromyxa salina TaxID=215803 RepID=A0A0C1Z9Z6_9BACT|nr:hypothetical protein [Enhygromyxa salina]KIG14429.1 hypothetical protein DB30_06772 [Enhygromyxa salina]
MSEHEQDDQCTQGSRNGGPDTSFLDFELHAVMFDEAESIVREAYRELLKDAAKRHLEQHWGDRITALANLAVDQAMADADANLAIQALIEARNQARRGLEDRVQGIIRGKSDDPTETPDPPADPPADPQS